MVFINSRPIYPERKSLPSFDYLGMQVAQEDIWLPWGLNQYFQLPVYGYIQRGKSIRRI
jgi:hypothetical protein